MRITVRQLKQIIREELSRLTEGPEDCENCGEHMSEDEFGLYCPVCRPSGDYHRETAMGETEIANPPQDVFYEDEIDPEISAAAYYGSPGGYRSYNS